MPAAKVFGIAGWSGSGKTTLIEQLIPRFAKRGIKVSLIKHAHHGFDIDRPGKDSWRHREAGASEVLIASARRWVLMHELRDEPEPGLQQLLERFSACELILVEGYKHAAIPKLEVHRPSLGRPLLHPGDPHVVAIASDAAVGASVPVLPLNDPDAIAGFIVDFLERPHESRTASLR